MTGRTIALGDIHGCAAALETLLKAIAPQAEDTIITLGDYIDRGPDSRGVIDQLLKLADQCKHVPLIGNHEVMMMMARENSEEFEFWRECGGKETLESYGGDWDLIPDSHFQFIDDCGLAYETDTHIFAHANYEAQKPMAEQDDFVLLWRHLSMEMPAPHSSGKTVVVGHTPQLNGEILDVGHLICIDTFCFGAGWLTAMDVESGITWQADRGGKLRSKAGV